MWPKWLLFNMNFDTEFSEKAPSLPYMYIVLRYLFCCRGIQADLYKFLLKILPACILSLE